MSSKTKYIYLTEQDTHTQLFADLRPIKALKASKNAYIQQIDHKKCVVYLQNEGSTELKALWVHIEYGDPYNIVYLLPHQKKTRGKSDPLYYFDSTYFEREHLINWLKTFDLKVYYAAGIGTSFWAVDDLD